MSDIARSSHRASTPSSIVPNPVPRKVVRAVSILATLALVASCSKGAVTGPGGGGGVPGASIASIKVTPSTFEGWSEDTVRLHATALDESGDPISGVSFQWASSDTSVATVDQDGLVTFQYMTGTADATITASASTSTTTSGPGKSGGSNKGGKPSSVTITPSSATVSIGGHVDLDATVNDVRGNKKNMTITWSSSDSGVAMVSDTGLVTGENAGTATITADAGPANGTASVDVTTTSGSVTDPAGVTDLSVVSVGSDSVTLRWTQVDDGTGSPADYALRYASPTISWGSATSTEVSVSGTQIGATARYTFHGLSSGTNYQFQLVSYRGTLGSTATFGPLSNIVGATTANSGSSGGGTVATVTASPSSYSFTSLGETAQLSVTATDSTGQTVSGAEFAFRSTDSSIVSVDSMGLMTAKAVGTALIVVSSVCCSAADSVPTQVTSGTVTQDTTYPNMPPNMTIVGDNKGDVVSSTGDVNTGSAWDISSFGSWWQFNNAPLHVSVIDDSSNPTGTGKVLRMDYTTGGSAGIASAMDFGGPYQQMYIMERLNFEPGFFNEAGGKLFYFAPASGAQVNPGTPTDWYIQMGNGMELAMQHGGSSGHGTVVTSNSTYQNPDPGTWHSWEFLFIAESSPGAGDGECYIWRDGKLAYHETGIQWLNSGESPNGFNAMEYYAHISSSLNNDRAYRVGEFLIAGKP